MLDNFFKFLPTAFVLPDKRGLLHTTCRGLGPGNCHPEAAATSMTLFQTRKTFFEQICSICSSVYPRFNNTKIKFGYCDTSLSPTGKVSPTPSKSEPSPT